MNINKKEVALVDELESRWVKAMEDLEATKRDLKLATAVAEDFKQQYAENRIEFKRINAGLELEIERLESKIRDIGSILSRP